MKKVAIDKKREAALRYKAGQMGLKLYKSSRRDPTAPDYGWGLYQADGKTPVYVRPGGFGLTLDEVEAYLRR